MQLLNFSNLIFFNNPTIIDRKQNKILISFDTHFRINDDEQLKGETCFLFHIDNNVVQKWIHKEIEFREGVPFIDPYFSSALHYFLKSKNYDLTSVNPLETFLSLENENIKALKLIRCFPL